LRFVVYGGSEGRQAAGKKLVAQMVKLRPELVVHAGGMVSDGRRADDWQHFDEVTAPLRELCRLYPCHCTNGGGKLLGGRFRFPDGSTGGKTYYAFDHKGARFVVLDSEIRLGPKPGPQTTWLAEQLAAAEGRHIFVFFHKPIFSVAWGKFRVGGLAYWRPLFAHHRVRAVFCGGHHIYYRTAQDGVTYVVTGGGGAPLTKVKARRNIMPNDVAGSFHHCIEVEVLGSKVRGRAVDTEGKTRDEFVIKE
jgi:hypothetical protein